MSIASRLFRLWLVLSVLWIGAVGTALWFQPGGISYERATGLPPLPLTLTEQTLELVRYAAPMALLLPVFVLVVGSGLIWAFRGFRS